ncbi:alpha/beta fold hydrolase [Euzebya tangerina]|uniref:alpha/beta fold hydrolase n=1 Tax=Euzebya tangerina TaxID=591198 RepID=UPI000E322A0A|nr:alpha/beta hydrolase [Euzebya tangerina]
MQDEDFSIAQAAVLERYGIDADERWVPVPSIDGQAHVLVAGAGPPIVLLNGIGVPAAMLAPLMAHLDGSTLYAVDLPGYGLTDTTTNFAADLRTNAVAFLLDVLDALRLDRPAILANSLGSLWTSWLVQRHPERVAAIAHVGCPAIVLDTSAPLPMRLLSVPLLGRLLMRVQPPSARQVAQLSTMVGEHPLPPEIADVILATERLEHFEDTFLATLNRLIRLRGGRPDRALRAEQLAAIHTPTLLVFARDDPMGGPAVGRRMADAMPNAELHIVDGGHAPWIHHADQIAPRVADFLGQAGGPGGGTFRAETGRGFAGRPPE